MARRGFEAFGAHGDWGGSDWELKAFALDQRDTKGRSAASLPSRIDTHKRPYDKINYKVKYS